MELKKYRNRNRRRKNSNNSFHLKLFEPKIQHKTPIWQANSTLKEV